jgi:EAL domain-containing protein (putative c-di-GMP-specific phosphodiesterase class I)/ActR/RegA family two-component response regulator
MERPGQSSGRLLILDDDPMIGQTIKSIAELAGLSVRSTHSPEEFFRIVDSWDPTHIAIDLVMPVMDGVQVMVQLAQRRCAAKIIITSGVGTRVLEAAGRSAAEHGLNITGVLPKPFSPASLRHLLVADAPPAQRSAPPRRAAPPPALTESDLRRALASGLITSVYQPKIVCATGVLAGFEVLARWTDPVHGSISPAQFIPLAEASGLIDELTAQVVRQALHWFAPLCAAETGAGPGIHLAVNISARTLANATLFEELRRDCNTLRIGPERLTFELTETSAMEDPTASLDLLTRLRVHGFHLSIDDFGTGFSSMLQLVRLPFSEIKVDKSFVMTAMESQESRTVTKFIVDLGHSLGLRCTAEGVEDEGALEYLRAIGCDLAQGYAIARPMPGAEVLRWTQQYTARS